MCVRTSMKNKLKQQKQNTTWNLLNFTVMFKISFKDNRYFYFLNLSKFYKICTLQIGIQQIIRNHTNFSFNKRMFYECILFFLHYM